MKEATVLLQEKGTQNHLTTSSSPQGEFAFQNVPKSSYILRAEKQAMTSAEIEISGSTAGLNSIQLILNSAHGPASSAAGSVEFADKPDFTVAGVTDWTAAGGHGSDITLRTSESLARDASSLKSQGARTGNSASTGLSANSRDLEATLRNNASSHPDSFEANHELGEFYLDGSRFSEAVPPLTTAYQLHPLDHANECDLARALAKTGNLPAAKSHLARLAQIQGNPDLDRRLGLLYEAIGQPLEAVRAFQEAVRLDPTEQNYFAWGSELLLHRAIDPAVEVFERGAKAYPDSERMLTVLGAALFAGGYYDKSASRLCAASDLDPADPDPYIFLGKADIAAPSPLPCAEPKLSRFVSIYPDDARANYYYAMAIWKTQRLQQTPDRMNQVQVFLNKAKAADPAYDEAYLQLGNLASEQGNYNEAISLYQKTLGVNPQCSDAYFRLGVAYRRTGEPGKAKEAFQQHENLERAQAASVESQRKAVKQFLVTLNSPSVSSETH